MREKKYVKYLECLKYLKYLKCLKYLECLEYVIFAGSPLSRG